jgi:uncharacterized protein (DUF983 family)
MNEILEAAWLGTCLKCPACRKGRIYEGMFKMNQQCPQCGLTFEPGEGDFLGAMVLSYCATALVVMVGIAAIEFVTSLDAMTHVYIWCTFTALFIPLTYRNFKGMYAGILYAVIPSRKRP